MVTCESVHVITFCMLPYVHFCVFTVIEIIVGLIYYTDSFALVIKLRYDTIR